MEAESVAEVVESKSDQYQPGDIVVGRGGWQSRWIMPADQIRKVDVAPFPISSAISLMGMTGLTAYTGLMRIGKPKEGETVVVAAASGAVGSVVGQIAKRLGCRVVGIAGAREKCNYVTQELGFDACLSHLSDDLAKHLKSACRKGIDVYFENVGGKVFDAVLPLLNDFARVPVCGLIANYNATGKKDLVGSTLTPELLRRVLGHRLHMEGFIVRDTFAEMMPAFVRDMRKWQQEKPFVNREDITDGLKNAPETFIGMLRGDNFGKTIIKVAD